ncbi:phosphoglucosamine mutase [Acidianus sulfidivorans JP7]|uniref:Phosphoglucosamine mutase n=1 Tax=Acidianus sulfidivorans JP7 TaxID=619593 RepID=A0A2U9IMQ8_9CREN|nr:phosphoglucosamine mutase [Acidianus sulfidivorans]AWR97318.1 phosphoglucosamine mutase [Acidianus sulfidivorans JP7]
MGKLFGTDGVRGKINSELSIELALKLGKAIGTFFGKGSTILIGRDARAGGDMYTRAVESGLLSAGIKIYEGGFAPTPALQFAVKTLGYDAGVIITASHNPAQYNGIKVIDHDGVEISREKENELEDIYFSEKFFSVDWRELTFDVKKEDRVIDTYVNGILSHVDTDKIRKKNFKVLIDGANSVGSITSPIIARELGCKIYGINTNLDPLFPARTPEPTFDSLKDTAQIAKILKVDLGVAHDGDADRAIFIDSEGRIQWGDRSGSLLSYWASTKEKDYPRRIFTAVSSSSLVQEYLKQYNIDVVWTKVGSVDIAHKLMEEKGIAGFEENGGFIFPAHQNVRDGGMSFALMLEMLAAENVTSAELFDRLPKYYMVKTKVNINPTTDFEKIYSEIKNLYKNQGEIVTIDGVKVISKDYWFLVRKSGTEPIIRIMVEAKDPSTSEHLSQELVKLVGSMV